MQPFYQQKYFVEKLQFELYKYTKQKNKLNPSQQTCPTLCCQMRKTHKSCTTSKLKDKNGHLTTGSSICNQKYILSHHIGKGTFGDVYIGLLAIEEKENENNLPKQVAIKVQSQQAKSLQLNNEIEILKKITHDPDCIPGFAKIFTYGSESGSHFMVMELLGPNLQDLLTMCGGKFSLKTSLLLAIQILQKIEYLHEKGYIYRDIKPENFVMGIEDHSNELYLVDFGMCRPYKDLKTGLFIPYKQNVTLAGTIRYSSLNSHLGIEQSRRDDLQSILYMLIYFIKGELPWQGLKKEDKFQKDHVIMEAKLKITTKQLCDELPFEIHNVFEYIKSLDFYEDPDYRYVMGQLSGLYERMGYLLDFGYDWTTLDRNVSYMKGKLEMKLKFVEEQEDCEDAADSSEISSSSKNTSPLEIRQETIKNSGEKLRDLSVDSLSLEQKNQEGIKAEDEKILMQRRFDETDLSEQIRRG